VSTAATTAPLRGFFASRDGLQLYHEIWSAHGPARATLLVVHGYGEHCGRYGFPIAYFTARGYEMVAFDYRGHGQAAGTRGHCYHFEEFLYDLDAALDLAARRAAERPLFVVAHSHGALVALRYFLDPAQRPPQVRGLCLSSPFLGLAMKPPAAKLAVARLASRVVPRLAMSSAIPASDLSHEPAVVAAYTSDRWVHNVATVRWFTEASAAQAYCAAHPQGLKIPLLCQVAGADRVVNVETTRAVFDAVAQRDKQLIVYPDCFHEIFNETERDRIFADLDEWLRGHGSPEASLKLPG
jgi:alpha-beta hydrolase superfamily lysophospholipase